MILKDWKQELKEYLIQGTMLKKSLDFKMKMVFWSQIKQKSSQDFLQEFESVTSIVTDLLI